MENINENLLIQSVIQSLKNYYSTNQNYLKHNLDALSINKDFIDKSNPSNTINKNPSVSSNFSDDIHSQKNSSPKEYSSLPKDFISIAKKQIDTYISKNADYGSATHELFLQYGINYYLIMIEQKLLRIKSIAKSNKPNNESLEDSLLDLSNYALLAVESLRNQ